MLPRVDSDQGVVGCELFLKVPPPRLPTRCSERLLSARLSQGVHILPSSSRLLVSAPSRRGGLAALRAGLAIDKQ